ncbi:hypothetical protein TIFTF001_031780 [Ficus carica]|uniref:Uncharacterized protein n=1 Tax=Ficus carica TaxID=3494 RepID=A0AA88DVR2_FICCA|nr:hypothetical protein TIFTF001_031780 [Ficus carica]
MQMGASPHPLAKTPTIASKDDSVAAFAEFGSVAIRDDNIPRGDGASQGSGAGTGTKTRMKSYSRSLARWGRGKHSPPLSS